MYMNIIITARDKGGIQLEAYLFSNSRVYRCPAEFLATSCAMEKCFLWFYRACEQACGQLLSCRPLPETEKDV